MLTGVGKRCVCSGCAVRAHWLHGDTGSKDVCTGCPGYSSCCFLLGLARLGAATSGVHVALSKAVDPKTMSIDGRVTCVITLTNSGTVAAEDVTVRDVLPGGFPYCCGTGKVAVNGVTVASPLCLRPYSDVV